MEKKVTRKRIMLHPYNENGEVDNSINLFPEAGGLKCEEIDLSNPFGNYEESISFPSSENNNWNTGNSGSGTVNSSSSPVVYRTNSLPQATSSSSDFVIVNNQLFIKVVSSAQETNEQLVITESSDGDSQVYVYNNVNLNIIEGGEGEGSTAYITY